MSYVFLPGTLCDERVWLPVWKQLNLPGRAYVPLQWANSLEEMLALTSDRASDEGKSLLICYSMGAYIAALWALTYPHKVASLTLLGYAPTGLSEREIKRRKTLIQQLKSGKVDVTAKSYLANMMLPERSDVILPVLTEMARDLGAATLRSHIQSTTPRKDLTAKLSELTCPVNLIGAKQDSVVPFSSMQTVKERISSTRFYTVENSGHMMMLEQPAEVASLLNDILI